MARLAMRNVERIRPVGPAPIVSMPRGLSLKITISAVVVLAMLGVAGYVLWDRFGPGLPAVTPRNEADLNPQLKAYLPRFIESVNARPRDYSRHGELGLVYAANDYWQEAQACFENAVQLAPDEPLPRLHLAIAQSATGDTDAGVATLRELTRIAPDFAPAHHRLGVAALDEGELAEAEAAFKRVIEISPETHEGYLGLADVKLRRKDYEGAKALLDKVLTMRPRDGTAHHLMGRVYLGLGREAEAQRAMSVGANAGALRMMDEWSAKLPQHFTSVARQNARAVGLMNAGRLEEAANVYQECLRYYPENPDILNNLATVRARQGRHNDEFLLLRRALAANERHHQTYSNLASYYLQTKNPQQAVEEMTKAVALAPTDASYRRKMGAMLTTLGRYEEAREHWAEAAKYEPENARNFAKLAEVCMHLGLHSEASEALQRAQQLAPNDPTVIAVADQLSGLIPRR